MFAYSIDTPRNKIRDSLLVFLLGVVKTLIEMIYQGLAVGQEFLYHEPGARYFGLSRDQAQLGETLETARGVVVQDAYEFCGAIYAVFVDFFVDLTKKLMQLREVWSLDIPVEELGLDYIRILRCQQNFEIIY